MWLNSLMLDKEQESWNLRSKRAAAPRDQYHSYHRAAHHRSVQFSRVGGRAGRESRVECTVAECCQCCPVEVYDR
jgi:hypothetical protein